MRGCALTGLSLPHCPTQAGTLNLAFGGVSVNGPTRPRTPRENPEKTTVSEQGGAESGAHAAPMIVSDPDLAAVVTTWPELPEAVRAGIVAMVRTVSDGPNA